MSREEILAVYEQGPEAVVALVQSLFEIIARQQEQINILSARVKALEERLALDSHNSSKPPSTDPPAKRTQSLRVKSGRTPGGQKGHPGHTLSLRENPDLILTHRPSACERCGVSLEAGAVVGVVRRQLFDLPPLSLYVLEHQAETVECPHCRKRTTAPFPAGVSEPVQYGPRLLSLFVYLHAYQLLPYARTSELLCDLFSAAVSPGTLCAATRRAAASLQETEEAIKAGLRRVALAHFDESGLRVGGKRKWLHVASTESLTHYGWEEKRGQEAMDAIGILPHFQGRAMHDHWKPYFLYDGCLHALCNTHHLRELTFVEEEKKQAWAGELKQLLLVMRARVERERERGAEALSPARLRRYVGRYQRLLAAGLAANPAPEEPPGKKGRKKQGKERSLVLRLKERWRETLSFAFDFCVPFDNNQAERDIRMLKVQQKVSGGFRSREGATEFCRIRSYISTMRKQGHRVLEALHSVFLGQPLQPCLQA